MRVLVAYDGSAGAEQALELAASLQWPTKSKFRIAAVVEPSATFAGVGLAGRAPSPQLDGEIIDFLQERVSDAARKLGTRDRVAEGLVRHGRAATALVEEASIFNADLIIAGSRGHGRIASLMLGSVSAELVENAPCPVLIARANRISRIVLAVDGSAPAAAAESLVAEWSVFGAAPIHVVSASDVSEPLHFALTPASSLRRAEEHAAYSARIEEEHLRIAGDAAARLQARGRQAESSVRKGDAADEIVKVASETGADLIVMGSRGLTGLARIVLGSVARNVLSGSTASVLIARGSPSSSPTA